MQCRVYLNLIKHVQQINTTSEEEMSFLKAGLKQICVEEDEEKQQALMTNTLKIHQILALIPADWTNYGKEDFLKQTLESLQENKGLLYNPRNENRQGRMFEQASKSSSLIIKSLLSQAYPEPKNFKAKDFSESLFKVSFKEEEENAEEEAMQLLVSRLELAHKANGKLGLYLHAYCNFAFFQFYTTHVAKVDFKALIGQYSELKRLQGLQKTMVSFSQKFNKQPFTKETYEKMVKEFGQKKRIQNKAKLFEELQRSLFVSQISNFDESLKLIERLLIQLLGHIETSVRDQATILLNMLYDGVDWQLQQAFKPVVRCINMHFKINVLADFDYEKNKDSQLFLGVLAPSPIKGQNKQILEWHKIQTRNISEGHEENTITVDIHFGKFWKCGLYDWRLVQINPSGQMKPLDLYYQQSLKEKIFGRVDEDDDVIGTRLAQGRFIVHAKGLRDQVLHEVQVDYQNAKQDLKENKFTRRGNFQAVRQSLGSYKSTGVTALHLSGVLERDNKPTLNSDQEVEFKKQDASHTAVTQREKVSTMLGGDEEFDKLMKEAKKQGIKIITDCFARISSSRAHRKYKELMLHFLDPEGRKKICYGTDGMAVNYEDTAMLNYRKVESWDLLIEETLNFIKKYNVDGIQLDNGQAWPQIMEPDLEEMYRVDPDGELAYSAMDVLNGEVVLKNENHGYWDTNQMETYPNPFFIKLAKKIWEQVPDFILMAESWGGFMFENRQVILARSGLVPRLFKLPQAIGPCFGWKLYRDGKLVQCQPESVKSILKWHEGNKKFLPEGAIQVQSSSAHVWPYPAYTFKRGTWAVADILYFQSDLPMTFMGEIEGQAFRIGEQSVFQHEMQKKQTGGGLKRSNSQFMEALKANDEEELEEAAKYVDENGNLVDHEKHEEGVPKRGLHKVRSGSNLAEMKQQKGKDLDESQKNFQKNLGTSKGFDLSQINKHYEHRRKLRAQKVALRYGELIPLEARHQYGSHSHVLAFARFSLLETAVCAVNLNESEVFFNIDMSNLKQCFEHTYSENTVVMVKDWMNENAATEYYFMKEILQSVQQYQLGPFKTLLMGITVCQDDPYVVKKALTRSVIRTVEKMRTGQSTASEQISLILLDILKNTPREIQKLANFIGSVQESFLDKFPGIGFFDIANSNHKLRTDITLSSRLYALCTRISEICDTSNIAPKRAADNLISKNDLGPIVFFTPELGRWSTAGGLGVMVDELSIGLADLGADVWCISPYYDKNRKGVQGYLAQDPAGIHHTFNVDVKLDNKTYTFGVHEGTVSGVKLAFLHNEEILAKQYTDLKPYEATRQLAAFAKASLEFCCKKGVIPSVGVTNDWFTGMVAGFAKYKFGETFKGSTFFHIAHNLANDYEGRIYAGTADLSKVYELDPSFFYNPNWKGGIINPSRCALICSDSWGTVSRSYLEELLNGSSLREIMHGKKCEPFAHSNGIPVEARIKKLDAASSDHIDAKRKLQQKYFHFGDIDDSIPIFGFVGRVTEQKGVHLICESAEAIIHQFNHKIQFIVGGPASPSDPYAAKCAQMMNDLKARYPNNFWAAPDEFFMDGALINRGCDFGLMPSKFEPGGIVQHEFFVGSTPVVAFRTGGLKDSVFEYQWDSQYGTGFTFESYDTVDMISALTRAVNTFKDKFHYNILRENAFKGVMHGDTVCKAWLQEFCKLRTKISVDLSIVKETLLKASVFNPGHFKNLKSFEDMFGQQKEAANNFLIDDLDFGAAEEESKGEPKGVLKEEEDERVPCLFQMHNHGKRHGTVQLCGTFDDWKVKHNMLFDQLSSQWFVTLHLKKGTYDFKFIIDGEWRANMDQPVAKDAQGNYNNVITLA